MENKKKLTAEEKQKAIDRILRNMDEQLAEHERFKEEYGKKYAGLSVEEKAKLKAEEYRAVIDLLDGDNKKCDKNGGEE